MALKNRAGVVIIAAVFYRNGDFVPEKMEVRRVIKNRFLEDEAVGNSDDTAAIEIGLYPLANFHYCGAQDADVDDVTQ